MSDSMDGSTWPMNLFLVFVMAAISCSLLLPVIFPAQFKLVGLEGQISNIESNTDDFDAEFRAEMATQILEKIEELETQNPSLPDHQKLDLKKIQKAKDRCNAIIATAKEAPAQQ